MVYFLFKKLSLACVTIISVVALVCLIIHLAPVDPARLSFGQRSDEKTIQDLRRKYFLDKSIGQQIFHYFEDLSPIQWIGNSDFRINEYQKLDLLKMESGTLILKYPYFRRSYVTGNPVWGSIKKALFPTLILAIGATFFSVLIGILLGFIAAKNQNLLLDRLIQMFTSVCYAIPSYVMAILISVFFGFHLCLFPVQGSLWMLNDWGDSELRIVNIILPMLALTLRPLSQISQMTRSSVLEVINLDFVRTAKAKGLVEFNLFIHHILKNALNPIITTVGSWFASLLTGAFFVEYIFNFKGMGLLTIQAVSQFDIPLVLGCSIITVIIFSLVNLISDLLYAIADPRIKNSIRT